MIGKKIIILTSVATGQPCGVAKFENLAKQTNMTLKLNIIENNNYCAVMCNEKLLMLEKCALNNHYDICKCNDDSRLQVVVMQGGKIVASGVIGSRDRGIRKIAYAIDEYKKQQYQESKIDKQVFDLPSQQVVSKQEKNDNNQQTYMSQKEELSCKVCYTESDNSKDISQQKSDRQDMSLQESDKQDMSPQESSKQDMPLQESSKQDMSIQESDKQDMSTQESDNSKDMLQEKQENSNDHIKKNQQSDSDKKDNQKNVLPNSNDYIQEYDYNSDSQSIEKKDNLAYENRKETMSKSNTKKENISRIKYREKDEFDNSQQESLTNTEEKIANKEKLNMEEQKEFPQDCDDMTIFACKNRGNGTFYQCIESQINQMLETYPHDNELETLIMDSKWVRVDTENGKYYVIGIIYSEGVPSILCYGVPDYNGENPPQCKKNARQWLELEKAGKGYWLMYQNAETGEIISEENMV